MEWLGVVGVSRSRAYTVAVGLCKRGLESSTKELSLIRETVSIQIFLP